MGRTREVVCLGTAHRPLVDALEVAGHSVAVARSLSETADRIAAGDSVVVICDTSDDEWRRHLSDLTGSRDGVMPVLLADIDHHDEFVVAISAGVAGLCSLPRPPLPSCAPSNRCSSLEPPFLATWCLRW